MYVQVELGEDFLKEQRIRHVLTPPYHPKSNELAALLRSEEGGEKERVCDCLNIVTLHATTGHPTRELLSNRHYCSVLDLVRPSDPMFSTKHCVA